jgi:hypothetical protein
VPPPHLQAPVRQQAAGFVKLLDAPGELEITGGKPTAAKLHTGQVLQASRPQYRPAVPWLLLAGRTRLSAIGVLVIVGVVRVGVRLSM